MRNEGIIFLLMLNLFALNASAYLDPGSASIIFQVILGLAVALIYLLKGKIRILQKRISSRK
jgi:hypothetical protein